MSFFHKLVFLIGKGLQKDGRVGKFRIIVTLSLGSEEFMEDEKKLES